MKIILAQKKDTLSDYDDCLFDTYHFPKKYINAIHTGDQFIYYQGDRCVWQVGIQPARQRKSNHFGSEIQPPYCSAIALSNVANGNSAHHA